MDERVNETKMDGSGAYADYRWEADTVGVVGDDGVLIGGPSALGGYAKELKAMGFQVDWDSGEQMIIARTVGAVQSDDGAALHGAVGDVLRVPEFYCYECACR